MWGLKPAFLHHGNGKGPVRYCVGIGLPWRIGRPGKEGTRRADSTCDNFLGLGPGLILCDLNCLGLNGKVQLNGIFFPGPGGPLEEKGGPQKTKGTKKGFKLGYYLVRAPGATILGPMGLAQNLTARPALFG